MLISLARVKPAVISTKKTAFVSCSFKEQDSDVAKYYTDLMEAFNFDVSLADQSSISRKTQIKS